MAENSTIVAIFEIPGMTSEQYDRTIEDLETSGAGSPSGRVHHLAAAKDGGWLVIDVWESAEQLNTFAETLIPILQNAGVTPVEPQIYPVHNILK